MVAILPLCPLVDKNNKRFHNLPGRAEVVEWQTRTFEGRVGKPMRVQVPPSAPTSLLPIGFVPSKFHSELAKGLTSIQRKTGLLSLFFFVDIPK